MSAITLDYRLGIKEEIVDALSDVFKEYPDPLLRKTHVSLEYPLDPLRFPTIYITYSEGPIQNIGVGHMEIDEDTLESVLHWKCDGNINFNVLALTTTDRDILAAGMVNILAFSSHSSNFKSFFNDIYDADFVRITLLTEYISPSGDNANPVPWNNDGEEFIYSTSYSVQSQAEFYSSVETGELVTINNVNLYPYRFGDPIPTGSDDPAFWV